MASMARELYRFAIFFVVLLSFSRAMPLAAQNAEKLVAWDELRARMDIQPVVHASMPGLAEQITVGSNAPGVPASDLAETADALIKQMSVAAGVIFAGRSRRCGDRSDLPAQGRMRLKESSRLPCGSTRLFAVLLLGLLTRCGSGRDSGRGSLSATVLDRDCCSSYTRRMSVA